MHKGNLIGYAIILILVIILITYTVGGFTQSNLCVLTQKDRYIGYELHQSFRFPWQSNSTYTSIDLTPLLNGASGQYILPNGYFNISNTIFIGEPNPFNPRNEEALNSGDGAYRP
jgi:hypothetical protein